MRTRINIRIGGALLALALGAAAPARAVDAPAAPAPEPVEPSTVFTSYGEINYNRPSRPSEAQIDLRRFVLGFQHRFDERTKVVTELEVEHAVSSASDQGEVEIEQAFVEHQFGAVWAGRAGLFLIPAGLLNEHHEPTAYYGVERNFVETAIIPSTWREGGIEAVGAFASGLTLQAGLCTTMDLNKWDATSDEGRLSPLGSIHQELQLARAHDLAGFLALDWRGVPGLQLGGSVFAGDSTQGQPATGRAVIVLWDVRARWTPGRLDLSALYTRGTISGTAAFNTPLAADPANTTLVPAAFDGWYVQAAYRVWSRGDLGLSPFARWEEFDTGRSYAALGPGLTTPAALPVQAVATAGLSLDVTAGVVVKADAQWFREDHTQNRIDLGLGWSF